MTTWVKLSDYHPTYIVDCWYHQLFVSQGNSQQHEKENKVRRRQKLRKLRGERKTPSSTPEKGVRGSGKRLPDPYMIWRDYQVSSLSVKCISNTSYMTWTVDAHCVDGRFHWRRAIKEWKGILKLVMLRNPCYFFRIPSFLRPWPLKYIRARARVGYEYSPYLVAGLRNVQAPGCESPWRRFTGPLRRPWWNIGAKAGVGRSTIELVKHLRLWFGADRSVYRMKRHCVTGMEFWPSSNA